jgi:hypothetical protein
LCNCANRTIAFCRLVSSSIIIALFGSINDSDVHFTPPMAFKSRGNFHNQNVSHLQIFHHYYSPNKKKSIRLPACLKPVCANHNGQQSFLTVILMSELVKFIKTKQKEQVLFHSSVHAQITLNIVWTGRKIFHFL